MSLRDYTNWFRTDAERDAERTAEEARIVLDWMAQEYHERFEKWLEAEASKPFKLNVESSEIIQSAVRANAFREVLRHLQRKREESQAAIRRMREET